ncbi:MULTISPECIES: hypothetical protein [Streptomyces]|uniref:hypothetical protein n=1 Tax=Streptomyces lycopersici TaxID=2974589 RepID=UPI0021D2E591|nr:hypothetical protein [Streptomyces sp. NEAU-383]
MKAIRYQTAGGAVVTVAAVPEECEPLRQVVRATCGGCGASKQDDAPMSFETAAHWPKDWADKHAQGCRALPQG